MSRERLWSVTTRKSGKPYDANETPFWERDDKRLVRTKRESEKG